MSNEWYHIPRQTKINAYTQVSEDMGMAPYAVEKDWWVVKILSAIFEMEVGKSMVFKGGTSLSKAWGLIERFSEDIDLVLDRAFFGVEGELTRSGMKALRKKTGKYIAGTFSSELELRLKEKGLIDISLNYIEPESSDADPAQVEIHYPYVTDYPGYILPRVLLEISCSSLKEPNAVQTFYSYLDEHYFESSFAEDPIDVPTAIPERTFLEKIFLLHEEFQRPPERRRVDRLSRHLYDIYQLLETEFATKAIKDKKLYETLVRHRFAFTRIGGVNYNLHQPQLINPIPKPENTDAWEADYKTMQEQMIYGDSPSYDNIIKAISDFTEKKINKQEWKMDVEFPKPEDKTENTTK